MIARYWLAGYALANAVILFDFVLERLGWTTISEWVWGHTPKSKRWVWYVGAFVILNVLFWTAGGPVAAAFLGGWLIAHLQGAK